MPEAVVDGIEGLGAFSASGGLFKYAVRISAGMDSKPMIDYLRMCILEAFLDRSLPRELVDRISISVESVPDGSLLAVTGPLNSGRVRGAIVSVGNGVDREILPHFRTFRR